MANLEWKTERNLENSFAEFLLDEVNIVSLTIPDKNGSEQAVNVKVGSEFSTNWNLPVISCYSDSKSYPRLSIGSNKREKSFLIIIDIRSLDRGSQSDLTNWVEETINEGFTFYEYSPNPVNPTEVTKNACGHVSVDFISNIPLQLGENVELFDKYRQNITLSVTISNS
jgi:hypothetical protein